MEQRVTRESAGGLTTRTLAIFAAAGFPVGAYVVTLSVYLPNYYARRLGMSLGAIGAAFTIVRVLDIFLDPVLGVVMDKYSTRFGRYRPWLAASIPVLAVSTWVVYLATQGPGMSIAMLTFWLLVLYAGYSMCGLSQAAWGTALVSEYHARSRVYAWVQAVTVLGAAIALFVPVIAARVAGKPVEPVPAMGWFLLISMPISFAITALFAPEPVERAEAQRQQPTLKEYLALLAWPDMVRNLAATALLIFGPAITAPIFLFFFEDARGYTPDQTNLLFLVCILAQLIAPPLWTRIAKHMGKHNAVRLSAVLYAIAQVGVLILPRAHPLEMGVALFVVGLIGGAFAFLLRAMVADICDEVRLETGQDRTGLLYALSTSTSKFTSTVSVGAAFGILSFFHFQAAEGAANTASAIGGLELCYVAPPVICVLLGALALTGYRLDEKRHIDIRTALALRDEAASVKPAE